MGLLSGIVSGVGKVAKWVASNAGKIIPALSAGAGVYGQIRSNQQSNEANQRLAQDQAAYNERMWNQQNLYNSPIYQMERLAEAGLNPRLIYGQNSGSAAGNAGDVKGYDRAEARSVYNGHNAFQEFVTTKNTMAQTDNIKAQESVAKQEALLKAIDTQKRSVEVARSEFDLGLVKDLRETSIQAAKANADNLMNAALKSEAEANVSQSTQQARIEQAATEARTAVERLTGVQLDNTLKRLSIELRRQGINESDNAIIRSLAQSGHLQRLKDKGSKFLKDFKKWGDDNPPFIDNRNPSWEKYIKFRK